MYIIFLSIYKRILLIITKPKNVSAQVARSAQTKEEKKNRQAINVWC